MEAGASCWNWSDEEVLVKLLRGVHGHSCILNINLSGTHNIFNGTISLRF